MWANTIMMDFHPYFIPGFTSKLSSNLLLKTEVLFCFSINNCLNQYNGFFTE